MSFREGQQTPPFSGTFERSHGIFHKHREVKRSRSKSPSLSGTFEWSHGIFHKHPEIKRSSSTQFSREMCQDTAIRYVTWACALPFVLSFWHWSATVSHFTESKGQGQQNKTNTVAFWNVRTKSRLFTLLADWNLADESSCMQREKHGKNPEKVHRQQTFRVNCRRYG